MVSSHLSQSSDSDSTNVVGVYTTTTKDTSTEPSFFYAFLCLLQPAPADIARKYYKIGLNISKLWNNQVIFQEKSVSKLGNSE